MALYVHVTSDAIQRVRDALQQSVRPALDQAAKDLDKTGVDFPAFGVLGIPLQLAHDSMRDYARTYLTAGRDQLDAWDRALHKVWQAWQSAEDANKVKYG